MTFYHNHESFSLQKKFPAMFSKSNFNYFNMMLTFLTSLSCFVFNDLMTSRPNKWQLKCLCVMHFAEFACHVFKCLCRQINSLRWRVDSFVNLSSLKRNHIVFLKILMVGGVKRSRRWTRLFIKINRYGLCGLGTDIKNDLFDLFLTPNPEKCEISRFFFAVCVCVNNEEQKGHQQKDKLTQTHPTIECLENIKIVWCTTSAFF